MKEMKVGELRNVIILVLVAIFFVQFVIYTWFHFYHDDDGESTSFRSNTCPILNTELSVWSAGSVNSRSRARRIKSCTLRRIGGRAGDQYGGWHICESALLLGSKNARSSKSQALVYSFGLGTDTSFDEGIIKKYGAVVHGFDPTPGSIKYVAERAPHLPDCYFALHPFGLNHKDGEIKLYPPENPEHISHNQVPREGVKPVEATLLRLATAMQLLGHRHVHILKIDVEGAEFAVLEDLLQLPPIEHDVEALTGGLTDGWASPSNRRAATASRELPFDQLCVEFHPSIHPGGKEMGDLAVRRIVDALAERGFEMVYDTGVQELSFARTSLH